MIKLIIVAIVVLSLVHILHQWQPTSRPENSPCFDLPQPVGLQDRHKIGVHGPWEMKW